MQLLLVENTWKFQLIDTNAIVHHSRLAINELSVTDVFE